MVWGYAPPGKFLILCVQIQYFLPKLSDFLQNSGGFRPFSLKVRRFFHFFMQITDYGATQFDD